MPRHDPMSLSNLAVVTIWKNIDHDELLKVFRDNELFVMPVHAKLAFMYLWMVEKGMKKTGCDFSKDEYFRDFLSIARMFNPVFRNNQKLS